MDVGKEFKSYIKYYWVGWALIALILIMIDLFSTKESDSFSIYIFLIWIPIIILNAFEQRRILGYVERYHNSLWKKLRDEKGDITSHWLIYFSEKVTFDDINIAIRKSNYKSFIRFVLVVFASLYVLSIISYLI